MPQTSLISFAWWNLENLYDPQGENFKKLPEGEARKWTGWIDAYPKKLANITSAIRQMNEGKGPDLLGVCEVFERSSLDTMIQKFLHDMGYKVFHHDSPDLRGIDVALLYRPSVLRLDASKTKIHTIMKRVPTRDILDMHFQVRANGEWLTVLGNHWPSRSGGQYETEPFRMMVAENASRVVGGLLSKDPEAKVLALGDFNDEPFNRSIQEYLWAIRDRERVAETKYTGPNNRPYLYNATWPSLGPGVGVRCEVWVLGPEPGRAEKGR